MDAIEACQGADTVVYTIRDPRPVLAPGTKAMLMFQDPISRGERTEKRELERIARETGGLALEAKPAEMPGVFDRIEADLRSQYILGYIPSTTHAPGSHHTITVRIKRPALKVRARDGYYAR